MSVQQPTPTPPEPSDSATETANTISTHSLPGHPDADSYATLNITSIDFTNRKRPDGSREPVVEIFGRAPGQELEHVRVFGFEPYFYVATDEVGSLRDDNRVKRISDEPLKTIRGVEVHRVTTYVPGEIRGVRQDVENDFESDINFSDRFMIDKGIENGIKVPARRKNSGEISVPVDEVQAVTDKIEDSDYRVLMLDIEVEDRHGFPENGEEPLISITTHDSYTDKYVVWYYDAENGETGPEELADYEPLRDDVDFEVAKLDTEKQMLKAFLGYLDGVDADVATGWNFTDFDAPYLIDRMERIGIDPGRLSRLGYADNGWNVDVGGRVMFDLLEGYKRTQFTELESYRLDAVGEMELDVGKEPYTGKLGDLWEEDPETLLEYNLRDVELCVEIDRKQEIIGFWQEVQNFIGCDLNDAPIPGQACDMYVLHKMYGDPETVGPRYVLPTAEKSESPDFEGGAVFEPFSGVREDVVVQDLKSLYPMSMISINASPETKVDNPEDFDGETLVAPNGIHFEKNTESVMQEMIDNLLDERDQKKELRAEHEPGTDLYETFDRQQGAVKVIMNSLYGVLSWEKFRLYDSEIGAATTATGREVIRFTADVVENELDSEITYGDTDSVMYQIPDASDKEALIEIAHEHEAHINNRYDDFATDNLNADTHRFQIEFEKLYRVFYQGGKKKRYAGHIVHKEGNDVDKVDVTGFEYQRSDQSAITKRTQKKVITQIVMDEDHDEIIDYLTEVITDFRNGEVNLEDIGMPGGIGKALDNYDTPTAQVRGAIYANQFLGTNFGQGSKPKRVYLTSVDTVFFKDHETPDFEHEYQQKHYADFKRDPDVICYEYEQQVPDEFNIDWDKMLEKTLEKPISRVIEPIGIDWDVVSVDKSQTGIDQFL